jgi:hypothetical protein
MGTGLLPQFVLAGVEGRVPSAAALGVFPMTLVPALAVPVSIMLHVLALVRLRSWKAGDVRQGRNEITGGNHSPAGTDLRSVH